MGKARSVPPESVLGGLLILTSFLLSPAVVAVPSTDWVEPALIWLSICMTTGTRKSTVYQYLLNVLRMVRNKVGCKGKRQRASFSLVFVFCLNVTCNQNAILHRICTCAKSLCVSQKMLVVCILYRWDFLVTSRGIV